MQASSANCLSDFTLSSYDLLFAPNYTWKASTRTQDAVIKPKSQTVNGNFIILKYAYLKVNVES
jgi:hypothetical protein